MDTYTTFYLIIIFCGCLFYLISDYKENRQNEKERKAKDVITEQIRTAKIDAPRLGVTIPTHLRNNFYYLSPSVNDEETKIFLAEISKKRSLERSNVAVREAEVRNKEFEKERITKLQREEDWNRERKGKRWETLIVIMNDNKNQIERANRDGCVYVILCIKTMEVYFGSTTNFSKRKNQHLYHLRNNKHHSHSLQASFNENGEKNFEFHILVPYFMEEIKNRYFPFAPAENEVHQVERELKKVLKDDEQRFINRYSPEFNVELDTYGSRHWKNY